MHIILGMLGTVVTILWLLHRLAEMGIDLGGLNPWAWRRRRKWRQAYEGNPIFGIESPMELTALLMSAIAKADGDMTAEDKSTILGLFRSEFELSDADAASLLISSTHLLGDGEDLRRNLDAVIRTKLENFSDSQARSAIDMLHKLVGVAKSSSSVKREFVATASALMEEKFTAARDNWS